MRLGICKYNIVAQRAEASHKSELVTQLLFGDVYEVLEVLQDGKWLYIKNLYDNYQGYIDGKLHTDCSEYIPTHITKDVCKISNEERTVYITSGCFIHVKNGVSVEIASESYHIGGEFDDLKTSPNFESIKRCAFKFLGTPYLWGGKTRFGIDCSGLVQQVYKMNGVQLLRDAYQQATQGQDVMLEGCKPGDLAFFGTNGSDKITHVGIILENNGIIHAHGEVRIDILDSKGIFNKKINHYSHNLLKIKRTFNE